MSDQSSTTIPGAFMSADLTTNRADELRDFYRAVVGWQVEGFDMGDYEDYVMQDAAGHPQAGICHARGENLGLPPQWIMYVQVASLEHSEAQCLEQGGSILKKTDGYTIIQDPAGAVMAIVALPHQDT